MSGIYIHIPFCASKCRYCDFFSHVISDKIIKQKYVDAICKEIVLRKNFFEDANINTIYFGGGTPSLLTITQLQQIFSTISNNFCLAANNEITLEGNPEDLQPAYLSNLKKDTPINRLSIGIQSFTDVHLQLMNRRHTAQQAKQAVKNAQKIGFDNITADLIYALPKQTIDDWKDNLRQFFCLNIPHLSAYNLTIEPQTVFGTWKQKGKIVELEDKISIEMYKILLKETERKGYVNYEISNFAIEKYIAVHNFSYWTSEKYLGIGTAAHSFNQKQRFWNINNINEYITLTEAGKVTAQVENLTHKDIFNETIITQLRTHTGINVKILKQQFPRYYSEIEAIIDKYLRTKLLVRKDNMLCISKKGKFISDAIIRELIIVD